MNSSGTLKFKYVKSSKWHSLFFFSWQIKANSPLVKAGNFDGVIINLSSATIFVCRKMDRCLELKLLLFGVGWGWGSPVRYVSIIQSNIESRPKMNQFNIQFKTKFEIFIQSKIHSKICPKYSIQNFIQEIGKEWFKMPQKARNCLLHQTDSHCCHVNPYLGAWGPRGTLITM